MGTIHTSVAAVINFMDAVTQNDVLSGTVQISVEQKNKIIWKEGRCAVIIDRPGISHIDITVRSMLYMGKCIGIDLDSGTKPQIYNIWLTPSRLYPFTRDMRIIEGEMTVGEANEIYLARVSKSSILKLMADTDSTHGQIKIWGLERQVREMIILLREGENSEIAVISGINGEDADSYYLKYELKNTYHKGKTHIYPAVKVEGDSDGKYIMAFKDMGEDENIEIMESCFGK